MYNLVTNRKETIKFLPLIFICMIFYYIGIGNYILFHTLIEMLTIIFGLSLMLIALGTVNVSKNNYYHFLTIIFSIIGLIDLFQALSSYKELHIFLSDSNVAAQLCIIGKGYECIMLNFSNVYFNKKFNFYKAFIIQLIVISLFLLAILVYKVFPTCYIEGYGVTHFKIISELLITIGFIIMLFRVTKSNVSIVKDSRNNIIKAIAFKILSCISFALYTDIYGVVNLSGHLFKALSYYYIFKLIFKHILLDPYHILFKNLNNKVNELETTNKELIKTKHKAQNIQDLYSKLINFIPDGVIIARNKKIEYVNNRLLDMLEIDNPNNVINKNFIELIDNSFHQIFSSRLESLNKTLLETPQQYKLICGEKRKWVEATSLIVNDESGEYIISTLRNIQDRKKAEEAEQLLELKKKEDSMKNEFFSNISHELRTPINVIYSALQVQNEALKNGGDKDYIIKYNKIIRQNCLRLIRLINNIIDVTRIESGFFKPNFRIENIITIVEDITMSIVEYVESKKIKLIFDTELEEVYVKCDSDLIERIILNLLSNSIKYGKENGIIEVYIYKTNLNTIAISIKDDGIGIPKEMKQKIFNRFLKVDNSLSRKTEGSGIGLSLVKQLIEIHKGTIRINSNLNHGTEFIITFPTEDDFSEVCATIEKPINFEKTIIESAEIEFSDIYD